MCKLISLHYQYKLQSHLSVYSFKQLDRRGGVKGSVGCVDNLFTENAILEEKQETSALPLERHKESFLQFVPFFLTIGLWNPGIFHRINNKKMAIKTALFASANNRRKNNDRSNWYQNNVQSATVGSNLE